MSASKLVTIVPPVSRKRIWLIATKIVRQYYPECVKIPQPVPIDDFYDFVMIEEFGIDTGPSSDLIFDEGLTKPINRHGRTECLLRPDVYDELHAGIGRARLTAAHECCHGIFHAPHLKSHLKRGTTPELRRRNEVPAYMDPEWQAFEFAGSFLMPTAAVKAFVDRYGENAEAMARAFKVSPSAAATRLGIMRRWGALPKAA